MGKTPSLRLALLAILFAPLLALVAEAAALTELTQGQVYRLQNNAFAGYYLTGTSAEQPKGAAGVDKTDASFLLQCWKVVTTTNTDGLVSFQLQNLGNEKYLTNEFKHKASPETGTYTLYLSSQGDYNTICNQSSLGSNSNYLHIGTNTGNAISYAPSAGGSQWTFEAVETYELSLLSKIDEAKSYLGNLQVLTPTANGYLFCNDPYLGNDGDYSPQNQGYNLLDDNTDTYFHSNYGSGKKTLENQWIRVTYPSGISTFTFKYTNRNTTPDAYSHIKTMVVEGSVDDVTYTPIKEYTATDALPSNALGTYSSDELGSTDKVYKYLRFRVTSTYQSNANYYYIAELSVTRSDLSSTESGAIDDLSDAITTAEGELSAATTAEEYTKATSTLNTAITTYSSTMESVYSAQNLSWRKESLKEQIDILKEAYIGETGFVSARNEGANKEVTYTWRPKYAQASDALTDLVNRMYNGLTAAQTVYDKLSAALSEVETQIDNCKALILEAKNTKYYQFNAPVTVSKAGAIIYYSITEKYGDGLVLQYNENGKFSGADGLYDPYKVKPVKVTPAEDFLHAQINNPNQAFYFMPGAEAPELYIYSYDGRRMCSIAGDLAVGDGKIKFLVEDSEEFNAASCVSWEIIENASNSGYYNLRAIPTSETGNAGLYLASKSNPNAQSLKDTYNMGYLATPDDDKALFLLQRNKLSGARPKYVDLYNEYKIYEAKCDWYTTTDELGYIATGTEYNAYMNAYSEAYSAMRNEVAYTDEQLRDYITALSSTFSALTMYVPTAATYYTFNSGLSALTAHSLAIDPTTCALSATTGMVQTVDDKTTEHTQALWLLTPVPGKDNTVTMQNVHTGLYVQSFAGGTLSMGELPAEIVLASRDLTTGQFAFTATDATTYVLTAAEANGAVSAAEQAATPVADAADCWTATKMSDLTTVQHPVSITPYGKAGFYSSHEVTLPAEVQAWYMAGTTQVDGDGVTRIDMTKVEPESDGTTILPKETAVLLVTPTAPDATTTYYLTYNTTAKDAITGNKLSGVAYSQPVQGGVGRTCYKFGVANGIAALYPMYQEYNEDGELTNPGTDDGGYIKASANKIYLKILSLGASRLEFRFTDPTTGIEQITTDANATTPADTCYDLQGRRIQGRPAGGIYIVNGVKRIIRR